MNLQAESTPLAEVACDWLLLGICEDAEFGSSITALDGKLGGLLTRLRQSGDLKGKPLELTPILGQNAVKAERVLAVGLGKPDAVDRFGLTSAAAAGARFVTDKARKVMAFALPEKVPQLSLDGMAQSVGVGLVQGSEGPGLRKAETNRFQPDLITLIAPGDAALDAVKQGVRRAAAIGRGVSLARELVNLPPCDLYPETFAARAEQVAATHNIECTVLDLQQLEEERMGSLLGVARGSERPPRLVCLRYSGGGNNPRLGLVGKGVTFDSGGLSLKSNEQMLDMKCDMAGAAAVLGAVSAIAELRLPANVLGILALVENMPSGKALKLGDVLKARNGKSIEVHNTDAEGRLILADALSYAVDQKAERLVDLATLTGSCMIALGEDVAGLMSNNDDWSQQVRQAAEQAGERVWPLPMHAFYGDMIKSHVADIKNVTGKRYAGAITAAKFLEHFVAEVPWVHLDIAGPAWAEGENAIRAAGGTGFGVRTLVELASSR